MLLLLLAEASFPWYSAKSGLSLSEACVAGLQPRPKGFFMLIFNI